MFVFPNHRSRLEENRTVIKLIRGPQNVSNTVYLSARLAVP